MADVVLNNALWNLPPGGLSEYLGSVLIIIGSASMYAARERIILTSPYFVPDEAMLRAISGATQRGVHVELFVSEIGDQALVYHAQRSYYEALLRAGVRIYLYKAPYILHSKHFSVDDDVAVIGSSNMTMGSPNGTPPRSSTRTGASPAASSRRWRPGST